MYRIRRITRRVKGGRRMGRVGLGGMEGAGKGWRGAIVGFWWG